MLDRLSSRLFWIKLCPLQGFARRVRYLLSRPAAENGTSMRVVVGKSQSISVEELENLYPARFGESIPPDDLAKLGFDTTISLLHAIPHVVRFKGGGVGGSKTIVLQHNLLERFEGLLQSQEERPVYHLLSGFSGPLKNRKQPAKEETRNDHQGHQPANRRQAASNKGAGKSSKAAGAANAGVPSLPSGSNGTLLEKENFDATTSSSSRLPTTETEFSSGKSDGDAQAVLGRSAAKRGNRTSNGAEERRRHAVIKSHFDIGPDVCFLRLDEIVVGDQSSSSVRIDNSSTTNCDLLNTNSIYFMPEGGRTSSPSLDSTDARVDTPPLKHFGRIETPPLSDSFGDSRNRHSVIDLFSPNSCGGNANDSLTLQNDGNFHLNAASRNGQGNFPPSFPSLGQDFPYVTSAGLSCPASISPHFHSPPPPPTQNQCAPSQIPPISLIAPPFPPPPPFNALPVHLPATTTASSLSRPTNCRFLSNETISKWISTGEAAMMENNRSGFVGGSFGGRHFGKKDGDARGGHWK